MINNIHFDYLSLTYCSRAGRSVPLFIAGWLSQKLGEDYIQADYGLRGYDHRLEFKSTGTMVLYGGVSQRDTVNVVVSGLGCQVLGVVGLRELYTAFISDYSVSVTRLDIAIDLSGTDYLRSWSDMRKYLLSPFVRKYKEICQRDIESDDVLSRTVYIGSRQSLRMLRIYGKVSDDGEVYTRSELEIKGLPACDLYVNFCTGLIDVSGVAVSGFDEFFNIELFLDTKINGLFIPVEFSERIKMRNTIAWALACSGAWVRLWEYYGKSNVDGMIREHNDAKRQVRRKLRGVQKRTPVGNTGVTNWSFDDYANQPAFFDGDL